LEKVNMFHNPYVVGKPRVIESPKWLLEQFEQYCLYRVSVGDPITFIGFCVYLKIPSGTLYTYYDRFEYADALNFIDDMLQDQAVTGLLKSKNIAGYIFYLSNKFGWQNRTESLNLNVSKDLDAISDADLLKKIEDLRAKHKIAADQAIPKLEEVKTPEKVEYWVPQDSN